MELIGAGRDADVFALGNGRVLRRSRLGSNVAHEVEVMRHVGALGFSVPFVFEGCGTDMVMERVDGPTMLDELLEGRLDAAAAGRILAGLANCLHAIPALDSITPFDRVIHLDLHPGNVILAPGGAPVLIDWCNSADGPPGLDNAVSAVIVAQAVLTDAVSFVDAARAMLRAFLEVIDHPIGNHLDEAIAMRRNNITMSADEIAVLDEAPAFIASLV